MACLNRSEIVRRLLCKLGTNTPNSRIQEILAGDGLLVEDSLVDEIRHRLTAA